MNWGVYSIFEAIVCLGVLVSYFHLGLVICRGKDSLAGVRQVFWGGYSGF